jgi:L-lactate dehydrogenase complex protein LldG
VNSRERILGRVRRALADVPRDDASYEQAVARDYVREHGERSAPETVDLLAENLADYRAIVHRTDTGGLAGLIAGLLEKRGAASVLVPPGLDEEWLAATGVPRVADRAESTPGELDLVDSVVTACAVAIAETGTIVLDGSPDQGRRILSLLPDLHVCVLRPEQVVPSVPDAVARLDPRRPLTWISGPSATSDIELNRVEGVHGPRRLHVIITDSPEGALPTSRRPYTGV